jgi:hypothetical protein
MQRVNVVFYVHEQGMRGNNTLFILLADVEELIKYVLATFLRPFSRPSPQFKTRQKTHTKPTHGTIGRVWR